MIIIYASPINLEIKKTSPKTYWSILKTFLNNKKIPCIPPLIHENSFIIDFQKKTEIFNTFFAKQCTLVPNSSQLPSLFIRKTDKTLSNLTFSQDEIKKVIRNLDPSKAHGHDMLSIRMLKICDDSLCRPLELIFYSCIENGKFPSEWKKANVCPVHKKNDKQTVKNYRPISLLPICGKIFERLLYNNMFSFFRKNNLISSNQSGFQPGDSCTNQLLSITHEIYSSFDNGFEVRGVFLDISKAFDKVWHDGLLYKLKQNGISGKLLNLISDFLSNRKQRVVLNGNYSSWTNIEAGVPQGSILGPLFFLIYINDLSENLVTNPKLFADDTSLFSVVYDPHSSANDLNQDLEKINQWAYQWKMNFNPDPTKQAQEVIFSRKIRNHIHPSLHFNNNAVEQTNFQKHLGLYLDHKLDFQEHLKNVFAKVNKPIALLRKLRTILPRSALLTIYKSFIRPHLDYGDIIYDQAYNNSFHQKLESIQYNATLAITGAIRGTSTEKLYQELGLETLQQRRWYRKLCTFYKFVKEKSPQYLYNIIPNSINTYRTRNSGKIPQFNVKHNFFKNSFFPSTILEWNKLDANIRNLESFNLFKSQVLKFIRPIPNSIFDCHHPEGIKFLSRIRLGLSHLREHKFKHSFQDTLNPFCKCGQDIETPCHYLLHCPNYNTERNALLNNIRQIVPNILNHSDSQITKILLFGDNSFKIEVNTNILNASINYLISTRRFSEPIFEK